MIEYVYWDFKECPISINEYKTFLYEYFGDSAPDRYKRLKWYERRGNYHLLLALYEGKPVGQSAAYKVTVIIDGQEIDWWWSVDTFVLSKVRGKGVGKGLQKQLHNDFKNFSSLWYSRANGHIKKVCGANDFLLSKFNMYPVHSFFYIIVKIFVHRYFHIDISIPTIWKNMYFHINHLFSNSKKYIAKEIDLKENLIDITAFIKSSLEKYDFYTKRDYSYIYWKYIENPTLNNYHTICIYSKDNSETIIGLVVFSDVFEKKVFSISMKVVTILDCFVADEKILSIRSLLIEIVKYYTKRGTLFDGVLSLQNILYFPFFRYPFKGTALLSTCHNKISHPYLSYSDQDMEQMIL